MQLSLFLASAVNRQLPVQAMKGYTVWNRLLQREGTWGSAVVPPGQQVGSVSIPAWAVAGSEDLPCAGVRLDRLGTWSLEAGTVPSALCSQICDTHLCLQ